MAGHSLRREAEGCGLIKWEMSATKACCAPEAVPTPRFLGRQHPFHLMLSYPFEAPATFLLDTSLMKQRVSSFGLVHHSVSTTTV